MHWPDEEEFFTDEEPSKHKRDLRLIKKLFPFFRPYLKKIFIAAFLLLLSTALTLAGPVLIKRVIDHELPNKDLRGLIIIAAVYFTIQIIVILVRFFQQFQITVIGEKGIADLKNRVFEHILSLPVAYYDKNPTGRIITRVEGDTDTLKNLFSSTAVVLAQDFALLIGMSVIMVITNARLFFMILVLLPPFLYAFWWFGRSVRPVYINLRRKIAEINSFIMESIRSLSVIQIFLQESHFMEKIDRLGREKFDLELKAEVFWYRVWFLVDLGEIIGIILVLGIGGAWALKGLVTVGTLFLFISYIARLFEPLRGLSDQINLIERALASSERVFSILSAPPEQSIAETKELPSLTREIRFDSIDFAYEKDDWILKDLSFAIKKGEKIALVGETGGGKTSIISLLLKFYEPQSGRIMFDGTDISTIERRSLRSRISLVPQDVVLFPGTVLENLRLFNPSIPEGKVYEAAQCTNIHRRIASLPEGYQTNIIEQGINLSFGERQLISFARAMVFDPDIVILDEATSSVDPESERLVQQGMEALFKNRTAIIIAHRLTTTRLADRVLVIHNGRLVEEGRHEDLLDKKGFYHNLYLLQYLRSAV
jgi:ABC-type multidrug transport system fused ATPase/permease subunit